MTRKEYVEKFGLTKTKTKCIFRDGLSEKFRTLYTGNSGNLYVFYGNDLHTVVPFKYNEYVNGMEKIECRLGAGYSWYH